MKKRCAWCDEESPLYLDYHDTEWGVPEKNDRKLFEMLILEGMQAGLSWLTILKKRQNFKQAFDDFDYSKVAEYDGGKIDSLMQNSGIIRNRLKIESAVRNAQAVQNIVMEYGSFSTYLWQWVNAEPQQNCFVNTEDLPAKTQLSETISKDLKKRDMNFVGPTIVYAFMQAIGMVNDHEVSCFRYVECKELGERFKL